ncbi:hypothetical protein SDC9_171528 [bioreactor metagenome]|uniref:Transcriptional regulator LacI/GalR-like sensor domain-containing protein n=1 Tax=bioreactor metagenome TaxID=1076179 RepID=A0A645GJN1_9ZZZZ
MAVLNSGLLAADGISALEKLAADRIEFDALAAVNAGIGEAIMLNLPRFNWRAPEHFSFYSGGAIPGFEDAVPLSTYYSPYRQMGKVAMEMLIDMIEERRDPAAVEQCKLPANYVDFQTI